LGDEVNHDLANYNGTGGKDQWVTTAPVGSFVATGYGLYDMAGNVLECCADRYDENYYKESSEHNPSGSSQGNLKVLRGGSWFENPDVMRCAHRNRNGPRDRSSIVGFRCVMNVQTNYNTVPRVTEAEAEIVPIIFDSLSATHLKREPIAIIVIVRGTVYIKSKASNQWLKEGLNRKLSEGDSIKTGKNSSVTLLYYNGTELQLGPNKSHAIIHLRTASSRFYPLLAWLLNQETPLPFGARRGIDDPPVLIYPRYGKVLSDRPVFAFLASAPGIQYSIELYNANDSLVWKTIQQDTLVNYPADSSKLVENTTYQVEIRRNHINSAEDYGSFSVASTQEKAIIMALHNEIRATYASSNPDAVTSDIIYAASLMQREFFTDALLILQQALKKQPNNQTINNMMAQIYDQAGRSTKDRSFSLIKASKNT
jgi:hypothetical protein